MNKSHLKQILERIEKLELSVEERASAQKLNSEIDDLPDSDESTKGANSLMTKAKKLEAIIAKKHPVAAKVVGELIEALAKIAG